MFIASTLLNPWGLIVNPHHLGLLELSGWTQVGAQVYRCMLHSSKEWSLVDPLTVILSANTKLYRDIFGAVSIRKRLRERSFSPEIQLLFYLFSLPLPTQTKTKV